MITPKPSSEFDWILSTPLIPAMPSSMRLDDLALDARPATRPGTAPRPTTTGVCTSGNSSVLSSVQREDAEHDERQHRRPS